LGLPGRWPAASGDLARGGGATCARDKLADSYLGHGHPIAQLGHVRSRVVATSASWRTATTSQVDVRRGIKPRPYFRPTESGTEPPGLRRREVRLGRSTHIDEAVFLGNRRQDTRCTPGGIRRVGIPRGSDRRSGCSRRLRSRSMRKGPFRRCRPACDGSLTTPSSKGTGLAVWNARSAAAIPTEQQPSPHSRLRPKYDDVKLQSLRARALRTSPQSSPSQIDWMTDVQ
jgi:hypothetical protein